VTGPGTTADVSSPALQVDGLTKRYGDVRALDGVSFAAAHGEVLGLLGHNGAGKSTAIRILTGRARPTSGTAHVLGHPVPAGLEAVRGRINLVAETPTVYVRASARENLRLFCRLYDLPAARADEVLERVRLTGAADRRVKTFSTGMRQRLLLARALLNDPQVLFLDEPTRGLDPQSARDLHDVVRELASGGATVLLTTHDMTEADALCHRVAFLAEGRIAALDTPRALKLRLARPLAAEVVLDDGSVQRLALAEDPGARERLDGLLAGGRVRSLHTQEATLADVFISLAGRALDDEDGATT
jgi:ABC-2 type transport system ATP-binding protein